MHDAGTQFAADAAQVVNVMQQRIHQRAARVSGGRVHDHASRLVDDHEIGVLVKDRKRKILGKRSTRRRLRDLDGERLTRADRRARTNNR